MSPLSPLSYLSPYSTGTRSGSTPASAPSDLSSSSVIPAVRESRSTGNAKGEAPSETGSQAVRAADESEAADASRKTDETEAPGKEAGGLDEAELKELTELKARDREVRAHEAAHQAVGGQYAGGMSFTYQRGPDGAQYAVGGEVSIDISPVNGNPQATIEKMRVVRAAAMAPAEPSGQDRAVAAQAMQVLLQAQSELASGQTSPNPQEKSSDNDGEDASARSRGDVSEDASGTGRQARATYQNVAGYGPGANSSEVGFLPISA